MDKSGQGFKNLTSMFPSLNEAKIKEGIVLGPQIREHFKDGDFESAPHRKEKTAWEAFNFVTKGFLGNRREGSHEDFVENLIALQE